MSGLETIATLLVLKVPLLVPASMAVPQVDSLTIGVSASGDVDTLLGALGVVDSLSDDLESLVLSACPGSDDHAEASSQSSSTGLLLSQDKSPVSCKSNTACCDIVDEELLSIVLGGSQFDFPLAAANASSDVEDSSSVTLRLDLEGLVVLCESEVSGGDSLAVSG